MRSRMLNYGEEKKELFREIEGLVSTLSLVPVEVGKTSGKEGVSMRVLLYRKDEEITIDDLEAAYNIIYPRYSVTEERDLTLEVSSPGLGRTFKDYYEFTVFQGKRVRLYSTAFSSYVSGVIDSADEKSVTLTDYLVEDRKEKGDRITVVYDTIAKAKLDYLWEDKND